MNRRRLVAVALAAAGAVAVVVGVERELLQVAPGYAGLIETGWGGPLGHEEVLLRRAGVVGAAGALATTRWRRAAVVPAAAGGVVVFYAVRAVANAAAEPGFYRETTLVGGETTKFVLGAEPFLLVAGGTLLVAAGVVGWRSRASDAAAETTEPSAA